MLAKLKATQSFTLEDAGSWFIQVLFATVDTARKFGDDVAGSERKGFVLSTLQTFVGIIAPKIVFPAMPTALKWSLPILRVLKPYLVNAAMQIASGSIERALVWIRKHEPKDTE